MLLIYYRCPQKPFLLFLAIVFATISSAAFAAPRDLESLERAFSKEIQPLLKTYCFECHSKDVQEAELDLSSFSEFSKVRKNPKAWQKIGEMLNSKQMPPKESKQFEAGEYEKTKQWVHDLLTLEAESSAGDPGPVILRRLNNTEYTWTLRDLTGVDSLNPAKEFPVDSGAGEGFTNVGNALVMSPTLLTKYLDSAKDVADHAVLLPDGMRFSPTKTRRDWTNESLAKIRDFYSHYSTPLGVALTERNLAEQVQKIDRDDGGRLPIKAYIAATLEERENLKSGKKKITDVARERKLSRKYLELLWQTLNHNDEKAFPLASLRAQWRAAKPSDSDAIASWIVDWQKRLWKFNKVGQIGRVGGPKSWIEPISPFVPRIDFRVKLPAPKNNEDLVMYLRADHVGDGNQENTAVWERPRLVMPGRPDLLLRDVRQVANDVQSRQTKFLNQVEGCLNAAIEIHSSTTRESVIALAKKHHVDPDLLTGWLNFLGIQNDEASMFTMLNRKVENYSGNKSVSGWTGRGILRAFANSSDVPARIPGLVKPHGVVVHPTAKNCVVVGWRSPTAGTVEITGGVQTTYFECSNGIKWSLELCRRNTRVKLAEGGANGLPVIPVGEFKNIAVEPGDFVLLVIDSNNRAETCDWTAVDLKVNDGKREWDLARDVSGDMSKSNPHKDPQSNKEVWHFMAVPADASNQVIPRESLIAKWFLASAAEKSRLAKEVHNLLNNGIASAAKDSPDLLLYKQLNSVGGPLFRAHTLLVRTDATEAANEADSKFGLAPSLFGKRPNGAKVDDADLVVKTSSLIEIRIPAAFVQDTEFVSGASVLGEGSVQMDMALSKPDSSSMLSGANMIVPQKSETRKQMQKVLDEFRMIFPPTLCYSKIIPTDEPITINLFYREDEHLSRLMLDDAEKKKLDRYWEELLFIAQEPLEKIGVYDQFMEYASQDRPDLVKEVGPLRQGIHDRADLFRKQMIDCEPKQLTAIIDFAAKAFRRPLQDAESAQLREFYATLRREKLPHDEAFRLTLSRVLVSPSFLYRLEKTGVGAKPSPVDHWELANRLSYFLWSSQPDDELRDLAKAEALQNPETLVTQAQRLMWDPKSRRFATEFGCQWLHIQDFDQHNEKSERHFPSFAALRAAMHEESILFFTDLIQNDRSVLNLLDADYTFLNEDLATHYGIADVKGSEWRRVDGIRKFGRGGVLAQAAILSKQSGASRTSPVLRGAWISEVLLGEKLPRPPKDVPQLADSVPEGLTERQLFEKHSADPNCMKCHARIDPFGFALENYDAIGRFREKSGEAMIDAKSTLPDKTAIDGSTGLRTYLATTRRDAFVRQFIRKLLGYSLGRSVQLSDEPLLKEMQLSLAKNDYRISSAIELIVRSPQFRNIRGIDAPKE